MTPLKQDNSFQLFHVTLILACSTEPENRVNLILLYILLVTALPLNIFNFKFKSVNFLIVLILGF